MENRGQIFYLGRKYLKNFRSLHKISELLQSFVELELFSYSSFPSFSHFIQPLNFDSLFIWANPRHVRTTGNFTFSHHMPWKCVTSRNGWVLFVEFNCCKVLIAFRNSTSEYIPMVCFSTLISHTDFPLQPIPTILFVSVFALSVCVCLHSPVFSLCRLKPKHSHPKSKIQSSFVMELKSTSYRYFNKWMGVREHR